MTIRPFSEPAIPGRWSSRAVVLAAIVSLAWGAQTGAPSPAAADITRLGQAADALEAGNAAGALAQLNGLASRLPAVADYVAFFSGQAKFQLKDFASVGITLEPVFRQNPTSPLAGRAAVLVARAWNEQENYKTALQALSRVTPDSLPQPSARMAAAEAQGGLGDNVAAAASYQEVFYRYPVSDEARDAEAALQRLEGTLGPNFPPAPASLRLERAAKLRDARRREQALAEYESMAPQLAGADRELAQVRAAAMRYEMRKTEAALNALEALTPSNPDANAERLYYTVLAERRLERNTDMLATLDLMAKQAPTSPWRLKALNSAAATFILENDSNSYLPLFRACHEAFPGNPDAAQCHWMVAWRAWLARQPDATQLLREHLRLYPGSEKAGASLYFLGRAALQSGDASSARTYWQELQARFPNYFYAVEVREPLRAAPLAAAQPSPQVQTFLASITWPDRPRTTNFQPDPVTAKRIERARILAAAELERWAESELRFASRNGGNVWAIAMALAETAQKRGDVAQGVRYVKATVPGYLFLPREAAPEKFWKYAFPMPYRTLIDKYSRENGLDPYLVAALMRQESEFDPTAVSVSKAIGLMQIMPATGRELARRNKLSGYRTDKLKTAEVNIRLGTYYLKSLIDACDGRVEDALAAYNGGLTRARRWRTWGDFAEPSEYVETMAFQQTRDYVHILLRNADIYRWLYSDEPMTGNGDEPVVKPKASAPAPAKTPAKTTKPPKKKATPNARKR